MGDYDQSSTQFFNDWEAFNKVNEELGLGIWELEFPDSFIANNQLLQILEYDMDEVPINLNLRLDAIHKDDSHRIASKIKKCQSGDIDSYDETFRITTYKENIKWVRERCVVAERNKDGTAAKLVGIFWDTMENELIQRDKLLSANYEATSIIFRNQGNPDQAIWEALKIIGEAVEIDAIHIYKNETIDGELHFSQINAWEKNKNKKEELTPSLVNVPYNTLLDKTGMTTEEFGAKPHYFVIPDLSYEILDELLRDDMKSILTTPLIINNSFWGFISYEDIKYSTPFTKAETDILFSSGYMIGMAINRFGIMESLVNAKQDALENAKAKSDFLSRMSHEIRTPMNAIIGMSELSLRSNSIKQIKQYLDNINDSSKQLLDLVNDVLDMSKIDSGKMEILFNEFDFDRMLQKVINVTQVKMKQKYQTFSIEYNNPFPRKMVSDELRLSQVLINLLNNAMKFTPEGGHIEISITEIPVNETSSEICISVTDSGIGITKDQQDKLFNSFEQADESITRRFGGTGLGLSISKRIINMLHGNIYIESELGKGSSFIFQIPVTWGENIDFDQLKVDGNLNVLIVDSNENEAVNLDKTIKKLGLFSQYSVTEKNALIEVEKKINEKKPFDFIILHHEPPAIDGIHFINELKQKNITDHPIIITTEYDWSIVGKDFPDDGNIYHLSIPILQTTISSFLNKLKETEYSEAYKNIYFEISYDWSDKTILLVEDIEINRDIIYAMLKDTNVSVETARDGLEAVEMYKAMNHKFDLILMDIQMPIMDGLSATEKIREIEVSHKLARKPIIAMTANAFKEDTQEYMKIGMDAHITKPISLNTLYEELPKYI